MNIVALNCPNCGGGVERDRTQCEFCKTRLKSMACPSCFGMMFVGSKFCGLCGAIAQPVEVKDCVESGDCPRCRKTLESLQINDTAIRACSSCDGIWLDVTTFESICAHRERQSAVLTFLGKRTNEPKQLTKINYVPCPDCGVLMNRNNFAKASGVIVDICKKHGVWLDSDELPSIVEFVQNGGMEIARQRERNQIEMEREKLREDQRRQAARDSRLGLSELFEERDNASVRSFVRRLFD